MEKNEVRVEDVLMGPHSYLDTVCHAVDNLDAPEDLEQVLSFVLKKLGRETLKPVPKEFCKGEGVRMRSGRGPDMVVCEEADDDGNLKVWYWNNYSQKMERAEAPAVIFRRAEQLDNED